MGICTSNAHGKLTKLQKALVKSVFDGIVEEIGDEQAAESRVAEVLEQMVSKRDDLRGLVTKSLKQMRGRSRGPRPHA